MKKILICAASSAVIALSFSACSTHQQPVLTTFDQNTFGLINEVQYAYVKGVHRLRIEEDYTAPQAVSATDMRTRIVEACEYILRMDGGKDVVVVLKNPDPSIEVGDKVMVTEAAGKIVRLSKY